MRPCQGWDGGSIPLTCSSWNLVANSHKLALFIYIKVDTSFHLRELVFLVNQIILNILEDDRKLTKFIIDYFNIIDIKVSNGKKTLLKNTNIKTNI